MVFSLTRKESDVEVQAAALVEQELEDLWLALELQGGRRRTRR
jgi:hypothetical protein